MEIFIKVLVIMSLTFLVSCQSLYLTEKRGTLRSNIEDKKSSNDQRSRKIASINITGLRAYPGEKKNNTQESQNNKGNIIPKVTVKSDIWKSKFRQRLENRNKRWVQPYNLSLRRYPSYNSEVVGELKKGEVVWIKKQHSKDWVLLRSGFFVPTKDLTISPINLNGSDGGIILEEDLEP